MEKTLLTVILVAMALVVPFIALIIFRDGNRIFKIVAVAVAAVTLGFVFLAFQAWQTM